MSINRAATILSSSALSTVRMSGFSQIAVTRLCFHCLRYEPRIRPKNYQFRRQAATAAQPRPQTLDAPTGARNADIPETSISSGKPDTDPTNSADRQNSSQPRHNTSHGAEQNQSIRENEAQNPQPTSNAGRAVGSVASPDPAPSASGQQRPKRTSKLRPRKAAISLTPAAVKALQELLDQDQKFIRVGVKNRGCSGLAYHLEYVEKPGMLDEAVDQDGVKVLIDSKALFSIIGSEMDWVEDKLSRRFVFKNPNITEQCGCGESFSIS